MGKNELAIVSRAGHGKAGYCKICASSLLPQINKLLKEKVSGNKIIDYAKEFNFTLSLPTVYKHKAHITDPRVTFVDKARANPVIRPESPLQFLETVVDVSAQRVIESPEEITIDHGLTAARLLMKEARGPDNSTKILILVASGHGNEVIEGEYKEV